MRKLIIHIIIGLVATKAMAQVADSTRLVEAQPIIKTQTNTVTALFVNTDILMQQGELVSNVLRIINGTDRKIRFRLSIDYPNGWKCLYSKKEISELESGDSVFVPVRMIPFNQQTGNSKFMMSAYIISEDDIQLANAFYWVKTEKKTSWSMSVLPTNKNYFTNGNNQTGFKINVLNTGSEKQPIMLTLNNMSMYSAITDSNGVSIKSPNYLLSLKPYQDTTLSFGFRYFQGERNFNRIDIEGHRPDNQQEEKTFAVIANSEEPNLGGAPGFQTSQKIVFTRLSDHKKANPYGGATLPLVVDLNVSNILNDVTFTTLNMRGISQMDNNRMLIYNYQTTSSTNYYDNAFSNSMYYLGYYHNNGSVQIGFINGGMMGIQGFGRGIKSDYYINRKNKVGAFYINNSGLPGAASGMSYGLQYELQYYKNNRVGLEYGRSQNSFNKTTTDAFNTRFGFNFLKTQTININFSLTNTIASDTQTKIQRPIGYYSYFSYTGNFLKNKLSTNQSVGFSDRSYANTNIERLYYNQNTRFNISKKASIVLVNGVNNIQTYIGRVNHNQTINNQLSLNISRKNASIQPQAFYHIFNTSILKYHSRGVGFSYNVFMPKEGTRVSTTVLAGYNQQQETANNNNQSFVQWSGFAMYRTITVNARYSLSALNFGAQPNSLVSSKTPQTFSISGQHQYLFSNTHFMLQTGANYYYNNVFNQHSTSISPELFYFTNDGWRFRLGINYNLVSGNVYNFNNTQFSADESARYVNQSTFINLGVRKEFGVPVPFVKRKNHDVEFVAFYDLNGNGTKDRNEKPIENVVLMVGSNEVITNESGEARLENVSEGLNTLSARKLDGSDAWFANISDSILILKSKTVNIPFVRGVRIKGKVAIDRESIRADVGTPFDLSRIKITANGAKSFSTLTDFQGNFEFYLPYGKYIVTMDENVLGTSYKLTRNNYEFDVTKDMDGMFISYLIVERKRKIIRKSFATPATEK
jgi:hypothetical protein